MCINLSTAMAYADCFIEGSEEYEEFPGEPFTSVEDFDDRVSEETWNGAFKDREVTFHRNLHLIFMACKASNISKFDVCSSLVDKRFTRMAMEPDNDNLLPNQVLVSCGLCTCRRVH
jgi:hypothetical protein